MANGTTGMDALEDPVVTAAHDPACDDATRAARARFERRAAERDELSALIAHDLKNPLSSVRFGAELLLHDPATPERVRVLAEQIIASTDGALALVASYLEPVGPRAGASLVRLALDRELRDALARARTQAAPVAVELHVARLEPIDACVAPPPLARGLDSLLLALIERAPNGTALVVRLERSSPGRAIATFDGPAPPPTREHEQRALREYARLAAGRGIEPASRLAQARHALEQAGAELYRVPAADGTRYRVEFTALV